MAGYRDGWHVVTLDADGSGAKFVRLKHLQRADGEPLVLDDVADATAPASPRVKAAASKPNVGAFANPASVEARRLAADPDPGAASIREAYAREQAAAGSREEEARRAQAGGQGQGRAARADAAETGPAAGSGAGRQAHRDAARGRPERDHRHGRARAAHGARRLDDEAQAVEV